MKAFSCLVSLTFHSMLLVSAAAMGKMHHFQVCSPEQADAQATSFFNAIQSNWGWTSCGAKQWLMRLHDLAPVGVRHIVDVGCNKGYESGLFFDLFAPQINLTPEAMHSIHTAPQALAKLEGKLCGACDNCKERIPREQLENTAPRHPGVNVYCFEPSLRNFGALMDVERQFHQALQDHKSQWHLYNLAVSNHTRITTFPRDCGTTMCSLHDDGPGSAQNTREVAAHYTRDMAVTVTIDDFVKELGLPRLDVLKIDTEGHDPAAVMGAIGVLFQQKVDLLYFEYNRGGMWNRVTLRSIIQLLANVHYVCYFEGWPTLTRLTGCWSEKYAVKRWSNVVCTFVGSYMYEELEGMSFLSKMHNVNE